MATKNPFGNLRINRDDDDDDDFVKVTQKNTTSASNFTSNTEMKMKKKVRPEEKVRTEVIVSQDESEGFQVVGKTKQRTFTASANNNEESEDKKEDKNKNQKGTFHNERVQNRTRPQKRQFERHSGTGRGKESSKNGAGGKTVWGDNPNQIAREFKKEGRVDYCKFIIIF